VVLPLVGLDPKSEWAEEIKARIAEVPGVELVIGTGSTRAERLQRGIDASRGRVILCHHPRSLVSKEGIEWLRDHADEVTWGGFTHVFDVRHPLLLYTSWYSNRVRPRHGVIYLDHCIFFQRELLTRPIPNVAIFEDTLLSYILRESGPPTILPFASITSAVRFVRNGVLKQLFLNQVLKIKFLLGGDNQKMNETYEKGLHLNDPLDDAKNAERQVAHSRTLLCSVLLTFALLLVAGVTCPCWSFRVGSLIP
jgi:hypothetical protein